MMPTSASLAAWTALFFENMENSIGKEGDSAGCGLVGGCVSLESFSRFRGDSASSEELIMLFDAVARASLDQAAEYVAD
jgi:hypothetical protein